MATRMSQSLGQQLVVENRPGAGSSLGAEYVARAPKDGYTLLMCTVAQTINPAMNNLSFDFGKDLAPSRSSPTRRRCWWRIPRSRRTMCES